VTLSREDAQGLAVSVGAHIALAMLLIFTTLDPPHPEYIELSLGTVTTRQHSPTREPAPQVSAERAAELRESPRRRSLDLPERRFNTGDEVFRVPATKKLDVADRPHPTARDVRSLEREPGDIDRSEVLERRREAAVNEDHADLAQPGAGETAGVETGSTVSYAMQWTGGGTRKKISGALPEYPPGANIEAVIKIEAVVLPDGTIQSTKPAQKGNTRLEEAAIKEVRLWRFERLRPSVPQRPQTCVISFDFRLR
jgi:outer membrane biosynthesis protein TonB